MSRSCDRSKGATWSPCGKSVLKKSRDLAGQSAGLPRRQGRVSGRVEYAVGGRCPRNVK